MTRTFSSNLPIRFYILLLPIVITGCSRFKILSPEEKTLFDTINVIYPKDNNEFKDERNDLLKDLAYYTITRAKPVYGWVRDTLAYEAYIQIRHKDHSADLLTFVTPKINLKDFKSLLDGFSNAAGFRIYPGYKDGKLIMILAISDAEDSPKSEFYYLLEYNDYEIQNKLKYEDSAHIEDVRTYIKDYRENIKTENNTQDPMASRYKWSRFYTLEDFYDYIRRPVSVDYPSYSIVLTVGYINKRWSQKFFDWYHLTVPEIQDPEYERGYTAIITLCDHFGPVTRHDQITQPSANPPTTWDNMAMEVGSPCPPVCGYIK